MDWLAVNPYLATGLALLVLVPLALGLRWVLTWDHDEDNYRSRIVRENVWKPK